MSDQPTHWLYPTNEIGDYHLLNVGPGGPHHANLLWDLPATRRLAQAPIRRSSFHEVPQSVRRANPATVAVLVTWMLANDVSDWEDPDPDAELSEGDARAKILREIGSAGGKTGSAANSWRRTGADAP